MTNEIKAMCVLPLRNAVLFPGMGINIDVLRDFSQKAIDEAMKGDRCIFVTAQKNPEDEKPSAIELYKIGCVAKIKQTVKSPDGHMRVLIQGIERARIDEVLPSRKFMRANIAMLSTSEEEENLLIDEAFMRMIENTFEEFFKYSKRLKPEVVTDAIKIGSIGALCDVIAGNADLKFSDKQKVLEELDAYKRVEILVGILNHEAKIYEIMQGISKNVKMQIEENQRDYYLREEIKAIKKELGEDEVSEADEMRKKAESSGMDPEALKKIKKDIERYEIMPQSTPDSSVLKNYIETVIELPWNKKTEESFDVKKAEADLDADHYGMEKVKDRILEYLAVRKLTSGKEGTVICLVGPPGTGKTSIAKSIAKTLNREYRRISLGGIHDEADIRGHRKTYIGAMPGRIMDAIKLSGVKNPLILFDEIDKMGKDYKGDPSSALLEVLDTEQNNSFRDHYIEVPFDLSEVMFIMTANTTSTIPEALLDRIEIIEVSGYTDEEKFEIAKRYLLPKQLAKHGLSSGKVKVSDTAIYEMINYYTREAGVRNLEREIGALFRKSAKIIAEGEKKSISISAKSVEKYLGKRKYLFDLKNQKDEVGVARGLAWTRVGGDTLSVEVNVMDGTGKVELTGKLGDVMKESCLAAVSYIRSRSEDLKIIPDFYKTKDIHIHVPEGAVPKDGPSAGITIATALCSALTKKPVRRDVAMTGEITLRGNVLPIGGLKEKSLAAYRAGIKTVIIPEKNASDIDDVPTDIRNQMDFIRVSDVGEVFDKAILK